MFSRTLSTELVEQLVQHLTFLLRRLLPQRAGEEKDRLLLNRSCLLTKHLVICVGAAAQLRFLSRRRATFIVLRPLYDEHLMVLWELPATAHHSSLQPSFVSQLLASFQRSFVSQHQ